MSRDGNRAGIELVEASRYCRLPQYSITSFYKIFICYKKDWDALLLLSFLSTLLVEGRKNKEKKIDHYATRLVTRLVQGVWWYLTSVVISAYYSVSSLPSCQVIIIRARLSGPATHRVVNSDRVRNRTQDRFSTRRTPEYRTVDVLGTPTCWQNSPLLSIMYPGPSRR